MLEPEFASGVDAAIDVLEEKIESEAPEGSPDGKSETDGGESKEAADQGEATTDDGEGKAGSGEVAEDNAGSDKESSDGKGDQEGGGESEEDSGEGKEEVTAPSISDNAIEQAIRSGFSFAEAKSFGSEALLLSVVERMRQQSTAAEATAAKGAIEKGEDGSLEDLIANIPTLDPEEFKPEVIEMFDAMKAIINQQQESIRSIGEQQTVTDDVRSRASYEEVSGWFDSEVKDLGEDFVETLGKGGYNSLSKDSSQFAKRTEIASQMELMMAGYAASGRQPPPRGEVFKSAIRVVLHDEIGQQERTKVSGKLERRKGQHIQRGSGSKANNQLTPEEDAVQALDKRFPTT